MQVGLLLFEAVCVCSVLAASPTFLVDWTSTFLFGLGRLFLVRYQRTVTLLSLSRSGKVYLEGAG